MNFAHTFPLLGLSQFSQSAGFSYRAGVKTVVPRELRKERGEGCVAPSSRQLHFLHFLGILESEWKGGKCSWLPTAALPKQKVGGGKRGGGWSEVGDEQAEKRGVCQAHAEAASRLKGAGSVRRKRDRLGKAQTWSLSSRSLTPAATLPIQVASRMG